MVLPQLTRSWSKNVARSKNVPVKKCPGQKMSRSKKCLGQKMWPGQKKCLGQKMWPGQKCPGQNMSRSKNVPVGKYSVEKPNRDILHIGNLNMTNEILSFLNFIIVPVRLILNISLLFQVSLSPRRSISPL